MLFPRRALDLDLRFRSNLQCGECVSTSSLDCCFWRERIARLTSPKHILPHRSRAAAPSARSSSARQSAGWPCPAGPLPQCNGTLLRRRCQAGGNHKGGRPRQPWVLCAECSIPQSAEIRLADTPSSMCVRREDHRLRCFWHKLTVWYAVIPPAGGTLPPEARRRRSLLPL